jgi:hypothetical protein
MMRGDWKGIFYSATRASAHRKRVVDNKELHKSKRKNSREKEQRIEAFLCSMFKHSSALFGRYTSCKDTFAFTKVDVMRAGDVKTTRSQPLAPYLHQISTLLSNTLLVLMDQSKCKNNSESMLVQRESLIRPGRLSSHRTSKLSGKAHALRCRDQENVCLGGVVKKVG